MEKDKIKFVGYVCPECGTGISGAVGEFLELGKLIKVKCGEESELHIRRSADGDIELKVPCVFCSGGHIFNVSEERFYSDEFLALYCDKHGFPIFFCGAHSDVQAALGESGRQLSTILKESGADSFAPLRESEHLGRHDRGADALEIEAILNLTLRELEEEGGIECECEGKGEYCAVVDSSSAAVRIKCERCGAYADFEVYSVSQAEEFLQKDKIILKK